MPASKPAPGHGLEIPSWRQEGPLSSVCLSWGGLARAGDVGPPARRSGFLEGLDHALAETSGQVRVLQLVHQLPHSVHLPPCRGQVELAVAFLQFQAPEENPLSTSATARMGLSS